MTNKNIVTILWIAAILSILFSSIGYVFFSGSSITIATGSETGVYYPVGKTLCRINKEKNQKCRVITTKGSVENIGRLINGTADVAIVQSDVQKDAFNGTGKYIDNPVLGLKSLFTLYTESITVIVRVDAEVQGVEDLINANIHTGSIGSGSRETVSSLLRHLGATEEQIKEKDGSDILSAREDLCNGKLDGIALVIGHPSESIRDILFGCVGVALKFLPIEGRKVERFVAGNNSLQFKEIPREAYSFFDDVQTIGVSANLVSTDQVSDEIIYEFIKNIFTDTGGIRKSHDALLFFDEADVLNGALPSSIHGGAKKYFIEKGLL